MSTDLPTTPAAALRWAAERITARNEVAGGGNYTAPALLEIWAKDLDAAPATYTLPAEPPDGTRVRDNGGGIWQCDAAHVRPWWLAVTFLGEVRAPDEYVRCRWPELLTRGPLSTVPPEPAPAGGEETTDAARD